MSTHCATHCVTSRKVSLVATYHTPSTATFPLILTHRPNNEATKARPPVPIEIAYATFSAAIYEARTDGSSAAEKTSLKPVAPAAKTRLGSIDGAFIRSSETSVLRKAEFAAETRKAPPTV